MTFAGINHLAVASRPWSGRRRASGTAVREIVVAAHGKTMDQFKAEQAAHKGTVHAWLPFALAPGRAAMAYVLAGMVGHLGR